MLKVSIEDFQAVDKIDLEIKGLTLVVGCSNIGKSAIQRAINSALHNASGDWFIREGRNSTSVIVDDGENSITWVKGKGVNDYHVNGVHYEKCGTDVPPIVKEIGYQDLLVEDDVYSVQISDQFDEPFMVGRRSAVKQGAFYAKLTKTDSLTKATALCAQDLRRTKQELKLREQDLKDLNGKVLVHKNTPYTIDEARIIVSNFDKVKVEWGRLSRLSEYDSVWNHFIDVLAIAEQAEGVQIPVMDLDRVVAKRKERLNWDRDWDTCSWELGVIQDVEDLDLDIKDVSPVLYKREKLKSVREFLEEVEVLVESTSRALAVDIPSLDVDGLTTRSMKLRSTLDDLKRSMDEVDSIESKINSFEEEKRMVLKDLEEYKQCPLCGSSL